MKPASPAPAYAIAYPVLTEAARSVGYALALHGTLNRDCDLMALTTQASLKLVPQGSDGCDVHFRPEPKPHGRIAYTLRFDYGGQLSFDLSILPRSPNGGAQ